MKATMSILGLYQYDNTLFSGLNLPGEMVKEDLINELVAELSCFEVLCPSAPIMKTFIGVWSNIMQKPWQKLYDTTVIQYDVLKNYDITKSETVTVEGENHVQGKGGDNSVTQKFPSDSNTPVDAGKVITSLGSGSDTNGSSITTTANREYGDASLRTTQQVLEEERRVSLFNMYAHIIRDFKQRFCLMIYE